MADSFVTCSSNPEGRAVQAAGRGRTVEETLLDQIGALNAALAPGEIGPVGAVIGPSPHYPPLDLAAAHALFLAPGLGALRAQITALAAETSAALGG
jgi:hypothetical protein